MTDLTGIRCLLPDACPKCGKREVALTEPKGPHHNGMKCACDNHRGWLAAEAERFIRKAIETFGSIEQPVEIRRTDPMTQDLKRVIFSKIHRAKTQADARAALSDLKEAINLLPEPNRVITLESVENVISKKPE
jgi:hypothetical protein